MRLALDRAATEIPAGVTRLLLILAGACAIIFIVLAGMDLFDPFQRHADSQVASVSILASHGGPIYVDPLSAQRYTLPYGPLTYLAVALAVWASGGAIWSLKLVGVLAGLSIIASTTALLVRLYKSGLNGAPAAAFSAATMLYFLTYILSTRADSLQLAITSVTALIVISRLSMTWKVLALALAAGLLAGLKIHSGLCLVPLGVALLLSGDVRAPVLVIGGILFGSIVLLPYFHPSVDLQAYLAVLKLASHHPLSLRLGAAMVAGLAILMIWMVAMYGGMPRDKHDWFLCGTFVGTLLLSSILASKLGAGAHHLLSFLPVSLAIIALRAQRCAAAQKRMAVGGSRNGFIAATSVILLFAVVHSVQGFRERTYHIAISSSYVGDVAKLMDQFEGQTVQILPGADRSQWFAQTLAYLPLLRGNPLIVAVEAEMDLLLVGIPFSDAARSELMKCDRRVWLVPRGDAPLSVHSFYRPQGVLYPPALSAALRDQWTVLAEGDYFTAYGCSHGT